MKTNQKVEQKDRPAFIKVTEKEGGIIQSIQYSYEVYVSDKKNEHIHFYIPGYNIFFFAKTQEEGERKADAAMTSFFNYWVKNQGKKAFLEEIIRLGFEETKIKQNRNYKLPKNRPNVPSNFGKKVFTSQKIAA